MFGLNLTLGKIILLPDDRIEKCVDAKNDAKFYDVSKMEVIMESDTDIFLNGTFKHLREFKRGIKGRVYAEQFVRGKWVFSMINRKIPDWCDSMANPLEAWYDFYKEYPRCPLKAGVSIQ